MGREYEPSIFTCTFCYGISTEPPHVLGRSARLTCTDCYITIINLSICWVCGELILRGTDCVSFGWCFWHRACYGCLLCGSRNLCSGVLPRLEDCDGRYEQHRGEDVVEPPLCALCTTECEVDGLDGEGILQRGLKRVDLVDGGVTRRRWEQKTSCAVERFTLERARTAQLLSNHGPSTIWIDINDPINGTSFRSRPLKPIPVRMQGALTGSISSQAQIVTAAPAAQPTEQATSTRMRASASASSDPSHVKEGTF